ncbi:hypothetical protein EOM09_08040, partial [bacterium]|nr:hypothetical protein [bacterium]
MNSNVNSFKIRHSSERTDLKQHNIIIYALKLKDKKLVIIHGKGISFYEVLKKIEDIMSLKILYIDNKYYVSPEAG